MKTSYKSRQPVPLAFWKVPFIISIVIGVTSCAEAETKKLLGPIVQVSEQKLPATSLNQNYEILQQKLGPTLSHIKFTGEVGDGAPGCGSPIVMSNASSMLEGSSAQKVWLSTFIPNYQPVEHALAKPTAEGYYYEAYLVRDSDGKNLYVCFDITEHFGK